MTPEHAPALTEFPELRRLIDLRDAGWMFLPTIVDGELVQVHGVRTWPEGWADALRVRYTTDAPLDSATTTPAASHGNEKAR